MNNVIRLLSAVFVAIALFNPAMAQNRHSGGSRQSTERKVQTQNSGRTPQSGKSTVSGDDKKKQSSGTNANQSGRSGRQPSVGNRQPDNQNGINNGNNNSQRHPANNSSQMRPGNNQGQQGRLGQGYQQPAQRPGQQPAQRPGAGVGTPGRPSPTPQPPLSRPPMAPQMRPHQFLTTPYSRPVPPPAWRPRPGGPSLSTILGITLGTAIDISVNYLLNNGYTVNGYNSNVVYLRNVNQLNYVWPEAALYYDAYGLAGSRFMYSTPYYNLNRYQTVYGDLVRLYGQPTQMINRNGGYIAIWFGMGNDYVQLQFEPQIINGMQNYMTTLSFGN